VFTLYENIMTQAEWLGFFLVIYLIILSTTVRQIFYIAFNDFFFKKETLHNNF